MAGSDEGQAAAGQEAIECPSAATAGSHSCRYAWHGSSADLNCWMPVGDCIVFSCPGGGILKLPTQYKFNEGYTNAVKRPILMQDLLKCQSK